MNIKLLITFITFIFLFSIAVCQDMNQLTSQQDNQSNSQPTIQQTACAEETPAWPPLPSGFLPTSRVFISDLSQITAGDAIALPIQLGFRTITVVTPLEDDVLEIEALMEKIEDVDNGNINVIVRALHTHDPNQDRASLVWHSITVQPYGGTAMDLIGTYEAGKFVGYKFDIAAIGSLTSGNKIAILDENGWRIVTVDVPLKEDILGVDDFDGITHSPDNKEIVETIRDLCLIDSRDGKAGLIWNTQEHK